MQENGIRYPQSTESGHFQHVSQPQGMYNYILIKLNIIHFLYIPFLGFVGRHMIPPNSSANPISQPANLPLSNESNNLGQGNQTIPQSIYQTRMAPMGAINSGVPISPPMNSIHQQPHPAVGSHTPSMMAGHQQPQMPSMVQQNSLPVGQPMIPSQHQQPMMGQMPATMPYCAPLHLGQYGAQLIPSHQINPQPSAPNQVEPTKVEQPQVAELISFD